MDPVTATEPYRRANGLPCPHCRVNLVLSDRQGVEIDYCPQCRGVWLDRGELDLIIGRSQTQPPSRPRSGGAQDGCRPPARFDDDDCDGGHGSHSRGHGKDTGHGRGRRGGHGSFLSRLFD